MSNSFFDSYCLNRSHLGKFSVEKQNLIDELQNLHRARDTLDKDKRVRDQELRKIRDHHRVSSEELKTSQAKVRILEQQVSISIHLFPSPIKIFYSVRTTINSKQGSN